LEEDGKKIARLKALIGRPSFLALALTNVAECEIVSVGSERAEPGWAGPAATPWTKPNFD